jgi:nucleoside-triphosphatase THEP1
MAGKKVTILTGEIQSGKTTALFQWVKERKDVAGILTPVVNGKRVFYSIPGAEYYEMEATDSEQNILSVGRFNFSAKQFDIANSLILEWSRMPEWKYLVIDEIGPLEIAQQKGLWLSVCEILKGQTTAESILVVRKSLCGQVQKMFEENGFLVEIITAEGLNNC